jgi:hypothetical protein
LNRAEQCYYWMLCNFCVSYLTQILCEWKSTQICVDITRVCVKSMQFSVKAQIKKNSHTGVCVIDVINIFTIVFSNLWLCITFFICKERCLMVKWFKSHPVQIIFTFGFFFFLWIVTQIPVWNSLFSRYQTQYFCEISYKNSLEFMTSLPFW